ncbi:MAG: hypothetical protein GSR84_02910 [Desulfurococcales archaeon]|nr:hypothetical protein [Desulfurococcales archaeon]
MANGASKVAVATVKMLGNLALLRRLDNYNMNTLIREIAGALALAHTVGIGHFNLKPQNILLGEKEGEVHAYVADFMNYIPHPQTTLKYINPGDLSFIDPHQLIDPTGRPDPRYDVFSYSTILITIHEGKPPLCVRAMNAAILSRLYEINLDVDLDSQSRRLYENVYKELGRSRPDRIMGRINRDFKGCLGNEIHSITGGLRKLIMESMTLHKDDRPRSMIDVALKVRAI